MLARRYLMCLFLGDALFEKWKSLYETFQDELSKCKDQSDWRFFEKMEFLKP